MGLVAGIVVAVVGGIVVDVTGGIVVEGMVDPSVSMVVVPTSPSVVVCIIVVPAVVVSGMIVVPTVVSGMGGQGHSEKEGELGPQMQSGHSSTKSQLEREEVRSIGRYF